MNTLTKHYHRSQYSFHKRKLETMFDMCNLNQTQKAEIRKVIDSMMEEIWLESKAPEKGDTL